MSDITTVPFDYIVKHTKTDNIVSKDAHGDYVCDIETEYIPLVRCKECIKANTKDCSHSYWDDDWGVWRIGYKGDDWYCADGERRENE